MAKKNKLQLKHMDFSNIKNLRGFLFIGDPHIWSFTPGRRRDKDYLGTILNKLQWCAKYCDENNLYPIILGDLMHESTDNDLKMISRLIDTMQQFKNKPIVLVGNHDLTEKTLTPGTVLHILYSTDQIHAVVQNGPFASFLMNGEDGSKRKVLLGGTPYGEDIPTSLASFSNNIQTTHNDIKKEMGFDKIIWITHEDLAFDGSYPDSLSLHPIIGVDIVVNGHMHHTKKPIRKGETSWFNPGNINRLTIDLIEHKPKAWVWNCDDEREDIGADGLPVDMIEGIEIPHIDGQEIISFEGRISILEQEKKENIANIETVEDKKSQFVEMSKEDSHIGRTDDGEFLRLSIQEEIEKANAPENIASILNSLFERALNSHRENK